jgi:hypothetical protein
MLSPGNIVKYTICINDRLWRLSLKIVKSLLQLPIYYISTILQHKFYIDQTTGLNKFRYS